MPQELKPIELIGFGGTAEAVPCCKALPPTTDFAAVAAGLEPGRDSKCNL
jgi:hypothetical protein